LKANGQISGQDITTDENDLVLFAIYYCVLG